MAGLAISFATERVLLKGAMLFASDTEQLADFAATATIIWVVRKVRPGRGCRCRCIPRERSPPSLSPLLAPQAFAVFAVLSLTYCAVTHRDWEQAAHSLLTEVRDMIRAGVPQGGSTAKSAAGDVPADELQQGERNLLRAWAAVLHAQFGSPSTMRSAAACDEEEEEEEEGVDSDYEPSVGEGSDCEEEDGEEEEEGDGADESGSEDEAAHAGAAGTPAVSRLTRSTVRTLRTRRRMDDAASPGVRLFSLENPPKPWEAAEAAGAGRRRSLRRASVAPPSRAEESDSEADVRAELQQLSPAGLACQQPGGRYTLRSRPTLPRMNPLVWMESWRAFEKTVRVSRLQSRMEAEERLSDSE